MSVWLAIPSKRPVEQVEPTLKLWRERGYKIALWRDFGEPIPESDLVCGEARYPGYAVAVNALIGHILELQPAAQWIVTGGDDVEPDPNHSAEEIAKECSWHFLKEDYRDAGEPGTFGVMQPTGDRWGEHDIKDGHKFELWPDQPHRCIHCGQAYDAPRHMLGAYIDRVCGSPWIGREFATRMYQGNGPYWPEYTHMGVDEELQAVAVKLGVLWQRPDLTHYHNHWGRPRDGQKYGTADSMPEFLKHANSNTEWDRYKRIFKARQAAGFPGHEPL